METTHHVALLRGWSVSAREDGSSGRSAGNPARQRGGLLHPGGQLGLVELVAFVDMEVAGVLILAGFGRDRSQRRAAEEDQLEVAGEGVERQEPALAFDAVKRRIPLHGFAHAGYGPHDERIEALSAVALPARQRGDVRPHRGATLRLRDLRVAPREELHLPAPACARRALTWPRHSGPPRP